MEKLKALWAAAKQKASDLKAYLKKSWDEMVSDFKGR